MDNLRIDGVEYEGTDRIIEGLEKKLREEWTDEEQKDVFFFLSDIKKMEGNEE